MAEELVFFKSNVFRPFRKSVHRALAEILKCHDELELLTGALGWRHMSLGIRRMINFTLNTIWSYDFGSSHFSPQNPFRKKAGKEVRCFKAGEGSFLLLV